MSVQNDIHQYLATLAKGTDGDFVPMTPSQIALQMGVPGEKVNKTLFNLNVHGKVQLLKAPNGRNIIGYKMVEEPGEPKRVTRIPRRLDRERQPEPVAVSPTTAHAARRRSLLTPNLDQYAESKARFLRLQEDMGDLIEATFKENSYAEEGLACRERMRSIEDQYIEVRRALEEAERDLKALRANRNGDLVRAAVEAGATVQHGD